MGCDIHFYTECKIDINDKKRWVSCDNWKINPYDDEPNLDINYVYSTRNYALFAELAGVRRGTSKMIFPPRGIPDDVCDEIKTAYDMWEGDGHTHSWLTMKELNDYVRNNPSCQLRSLLEAVTPLFKEVFWIFRELSDDDIEKYNKKFRMVFWFDN